VICSTPGNYSSHMSPAVENILVLGCVCQLDIKENDDDDGPDVAAIAVNSDDDGPDVAAIADSDIFFV